MPTETVELRVELTPKEAAALRRIQREDRAWVAKTLRMGLMRRAMRSQPTPRGSRNEHGGPI